jgi:hypothetical protein
VKRPRTSDGNNGIKKEGRNSNTTKVKRISLGGGGGDEKKNRNSYQKKAVVVVKKEEETTTTKEVKEEKKKKEKDVDRKTDFDELPGSLLSCKVCQKMMNDGKVKKDKINDKILDLKLDLKLQSFDSHLTGKAHQSLMRILEERFAKRVELLMTESKVCF